MKFFVFLVLLALAGAVCAAGTRGVEDLTNLERLAKVKAALPGATAALEKAQAEATAARKAFTALREGLRPHLDRAPETVRTAVKTFLRTKSRHERAKLMAAWHTAQATKSDVTSTGFSALADAAEKTVSEHMDADESKDAWAKLRISLKSRVAAHQKLFEARWAVQRLKRARARLSDRTVRRDQRKAAVDREKKATKDATDRANEQDNKTADEKAADEKAAADKAAADKAAADKAAADKAAADKAAVDLKDVRSSVNALYVASCDLGHDKQKFCGADAQNAMTADLAGLKRAIKEIFLYRDCRFGAADVIAKCKTDAAAKADGVVSIADLAEVLNKDKAEQDEKLRIQRENNK